MITTIFNSVLYHEFVYKLQEYWKIFKTNLKINLGINSFFHWANTKKIKEGTFIEKKNVLYRGWKRWKKKMEEDFSQKRVWYIFQQRR